MTRPAKVKLRAMFILGVVSSAVLAAPTSVGPSLSFEARSTEAWQAVQPPTEQGSAALEVPSANDGLPGGHASNALDARAVENANVDVPRQVSVEHTVNTYLKRALGDNQQTQNSASPDGESTSTGRDTVRTAAENASPHFERQVVEDMQKKEKQDDKGMPGTTRLTAWSWNANGGNHLGDPLTSKSSLSTENPVSMLGMEESNKAAGNAREVFKDADPNSIMQEFLDYNLLQLDG
ncbi:hypothetical protein EV360DRAFT_81971 [Lentinula raphanica]|nr:hypothetical protein EV360DRAFT_81971 [Lentinula raphanica]